MYRTKTAFQVTFLTFDSHRAPLSRNFDILQTWFTPLFDAVKDKSNSRSVIWLLTIQQLNKIKEDEMYSW